MQEPDLPAVNPLPSAPATEGPRTSGKPAVDDSQHGVPINFAAALRLAGVNPLDIAAATFEVRQGLAVLLQAKVLWIPNLNAGVDYARHDGVQQNIFPGSPHRKDRQSCFLGGGPSLLVARTDAIYEPHAQRRVLAARVASVQTARNDVLLAVSRAYFTLQDARGRLVGVEATIVRAQKLVDLAIGLAPARLIAPLEINRAKAELQSLKQTREVAIRDWMVASAALAEILLLDPETLLEPEEPPFSQVKLIPGRPNGGRVGSDRGSTTDPRLRRSESCWPRLAAAAETGEEASVSTHHDYHQQQHDHRPFWPPSSLSAGPKARLGANAPAANFEVAAVWRLQNAEDRQYRPHPPAPGRAGHRHRLM